MNKLLKSHNDKLNRLVNVSRTRRSNELDFFTDISNKYREFLNYPLATNYNEDKKLAEIIKDAFLAEANDPLYGVIARQTRLNLDAKNMSQEEIKADKKFINDYFKKLESIEKLGGYLIVAVEPIAPDNLPSFLANYDNVNINGTNERVRDRNMFLVAGWSTCFDYVDDVFVEKDFRFQTNENSELTILTQRIYIDVTGETFRKYLHNKPYIIDDFLRNKNLITRENGKTYYVIYGEVDSNQVVNGDLLDLYISEVPPSMKLGETFDNAGITKNATLQPQFFLGGTVMSEDASDPQQDTSIKVPMFSVKDNKVSRYFVKPINTEAINKTPAYVSEIQSHIAGLFGLASGDISVLSGYSNKRMGIDLPLGINETITGDLEKLYDNLSPEGKVAWVGNRYAFNTISPNSKQKISLIDSQKAWIMSVILNYNLDKKLIQEDVPNGPSIVKETLEDKTQQGKDLIKALNDNNLPIPEVYRSMLGINEWQPGMAVYYQKLPEEVTDLPVEQTEEIATFVEQYS